MSSPGSCVRRSSCSQHPFSLKTESHQCSLQHLLHSSSRFPGGHRCSHTVQFVRQHRSIAAIQLRRNAAVEGKSAHEKAGSRGPHRSFGSRYGGRTQCDGSKGMAQEPGSPRPRTGAPGILRRVTRRATSPALAFIVPLPSPCFRSALSARLSPRSVTSSSVAPGKLWTWTGADATHKLPTRNVGVYEITTGALAIKPLEPATHPTLKSIWVIDRAPLTLLNTDMVVRLAAPLPVDLTATLEEERIRKAPAAKLRRAAGAPGPLRIYDGTWLTESGIKGVPAVGCGDEWSILS